MAALAALAMLAESPAPVSSKPRKYSGGSEKGYRPRPKLSGSLRNQPCPKCGKKLKRCGHSAHPDNRRHRGTCPGCGRALGLPASGPAKCHGCSAPIPDAIGGAA